MGPIKYVAHMIKSFEQMNLVTYLGQPNQLIEPIDE